MDIVRAGGTAWLAYENGHGILIDTGSRKDGANVLRRVRSLNVAILLLFLTHTHYDHTGGANAVLQRQAPPLLQALPRYPCCVPDIPLSRQAQVVWAACWFVR